MIKNKTILTLGMSAISMLLTSPPCNAGRNYESRMLTGSISDDSHGWVTNVAELTPNTGKLLLSWRMFLEDTKETAFDLYINKEGRMEKLNDAPIVNTTCFQVPERFTTGTSDLTFSLCYSGEEDAIDTYTMPRRQFEEKLPYTSIYIEETASDSRINDVAEYIINDAAVGDLDGDGVCEIILSRNAYGYEEGKVPRSPLIMEAYRLDGTFMWRVVWGNNIPASNSIAMIVADFTGNGAAEVAIRSSEGTIFGDGTTIGDTNGDGRTEYALPDAYNSEAPEFISILDGLTGAEIARAPYIPIVTSEYWGDNYFKRANSLRLCASKLLPGDRFQIVACRGIYARMELEAWEYVPGESELSRVWKFTTDDYPDYIGQGNHQLAVADVDGDGFDEITYGASCIDHDGTGLYSTELGHGDMLHVGKFIKDREGLQCFQCFETGKTRVALRDASTGEILWSLVGEEDNDEGRCLISDIDPDNTGYEAWAYDREMYDAEGNALGTLAPYTNFPIWWTGSLNRQLFDRMTIEKFSRTDTKTRVFNMHRYDAACHNSTKSNACFIGDITGDWREEIVIAKKHPTAVENNRELPGSTELMIFTTWHPTEYRFPYLMSDAVYYRGTIHQHVGYNTPVHLGYYFGSDMDFSGIETIAEDSRIKVGVRGGKLEFSEAVDIVEIFSLEGRSVMKAAGVVTMDVNSLRSGCYIVSYSSGGRNYSCKIML